MTTNTKIRFVFEIVKLNYAFTTRHECVKFIIWINESKHKLYDSQTRGHAKVGAHENVTSYRERSWQRNTSTYIRI